MSNLKKEAMGQYNYLVPQMDLKKVIKRRKHQLQSKPADDVTVQIIDQIPVDMNLFNIKPPKIFDTSYEHDYRRPPQENFVCHRDDLKDNYTHYAQPPARPSRKDKQVTKAEAVNIPSTVKREDMGSVKQSNKMPSPQKVVRSQTAEPSKREDSKPNRANEEFNRAVINARAGDEWKRPPDISYDVLNPEKPKQGRKTKPYGAHMENTQEKIAEIKEEVKPRRRPSTVQHLTPASQEGPRARSALDTIVIAPKVKRIGLVSEPGSRASSVASGRTSAADSHVNRVTLMTGGGSRGSSVSSVNGDYFLETGRHLHPSLETIQEEEILDHVQSPIPNTAGGREVTKSAPAFRSSKTKLKKPIPPVNLYKSKGPDSRFYPGKKNLRTPNEMERFRKARNRTFMRNVEQAIPELDARDHEVKYQPERQLLQDARYSIRQNVKNVRNKNLYSLVDRFEKRHQIITDETKTRLGDPTYIGRNPLSVYKVNDRTDRPGKQSHHIGYPLHSRARVTPSLGSVQRARNLGSHAQIFNQANAPPNWGPQKVDSGLFLPPMAQGV